MLVPWMVYEFSLEWDLPICSQKNGWNHLLQVAHQEALRVPWGVKTYVYHIPPFFWKDAVARAPTEKKIHCFFCFMMLCPFEFAVCVSFFRFLCDLPGFQLYHFQE